MLIRAVTIVGSSSSRNMGREHRGSRLFKHRRSGLFKHRGSGLFKQADPDFLNIRIQTF